jgi:hypothetical protein
LEETSKEVEVLGDENDDDENDVDAKKCKVVAQMKAEILQRMQLLATRWTRLHE